jgi:formate-dependent nitrite reductase membrane component NrfD
MKNYEFLFLVSEIMLGLCIGLILSFRLDKDEGKQGIVYACIFGIGIGVCILIEGCHEKYLADKQQTFKTE